MFHAVHSTFVGADGQTYFVVSDREGPGGCGSCALFTMPECHLHTCIGELRDDKHPVHFTKTVPTTWYTVQLMRPLPRNAVRTVSFRNIGGVDG